MRKTSNRGPFWASDRKPVLIYGSPKERTQKNRTLLFSARVAALLNHDAAIFRLSMHLRVGAAHAK